MPFQLSPGVNFSEIDLTNIIPAVSSTAGGFVGSFSWGSANSIELITSEKDLVTTFGSPTKDNYISFFTASNFLGYGNNLKLIRAVADDATNATNGDKPIRILNEEDYELNYTKGQNSLPDTYFSARYAGSLGNSLKISMCPSSDAFAKTYTNIITDGNKLSFSDEDVLVADKIVVGSFIYYVGVERQVVDIVDGFAILNEPFFTNIYSGDSVTVRWEYFSFFDTPPTTSEYIADRGGKNDELHIVVVDELGKFTDYPNTILETYQGLSKSFDGKEYNGTNSYYQTALLKKSKYVYLLDHCSNNADKWGQSVLEVKDYNEIPDSLPTTFFLSGGSDGKKELAEGDYMVGYDLLNDPEKVDISLILTGNAPLVVSLYALAIAEKRKDCVAFISPPFNSCVNNKDSETEDIVAYRDRFPSSSYGFFDSNWKYQYDKYNDIYRWLPLNGDIAGLCVRTDMLRDSWWSPAGFNRGGIRNVVKLGWKPEQGDRDELYKKSINSVLIFPGEGAVLYGDKTMQIKPSAFDRINVRRLFIVLEKAISTAAKYLLFEFNDPVTRTTFLNMVNPYLRMVQGRRGITDFSVVADESNNTSDVMDRNEFIGDIYIKPARSINYIQLNFVAVATGVTFNEVVGKY